jgi:hypothetical protein
MSLFLHCFVLAGLGSTTRSQAQEMSHPDFRESKTPGVNFTTCATIKSHTYDDSWYRTNVTSLIYKGVLY